MSETHVRAGSSQLITGHTQRACSCGWTIIGTSAAAFEAREQHIAENEQVSA